MQKIAVVTGVIKNQPATPLPTNIGQIHSNGTSFLCYTRYEIAPVPAATGYSAQLTTDEANTTANLGNYPTLTSWVNVTGTTVSYGGFTWTVQNSGRVGTCYRDSADSNIFQFECAPGDVWASDGAGVERTELQCVTKFAFNTAYQITYSYRLFALDTPAVTSTGWVIVNQIHGTPDAGDSQSLSPLWSRELTAARAYIYSRRTSATDPLLVNPTQNISYTNSAASYGSWIRVKEQHYFDPTGGNGYHRVWHDDVVIYTYSGNTAYVDATGPYYKMGIYRATDSSRTFRVQIANWTQT